MDRKVLCILFHCLSGKRDAVKAVWEKYIKNHAAKNPNVLFSCYSFVTDDPDAILLYEVLSGDESLDSTYSQDWFKEYIAEIGALWSAPPQVMNAVPVWIKPAQID